MTKLEKAARQALVALEDVMADFDGSWALADTAITALREALAEQAEHEPVAYVLWGDNNVPSLQWEKPNDGVFNQLYYAAPVQKVDLTDDEIKASYESWWDTHGNHAFPIWVGAKAVIAAYKEKNK